MIREELERAIKALGWNMSEGIIDLVYDQVKTLYLDYEQLVQVGLKINNKPGVQKLVSEIFNLSRKKTPKAIHELIRLDADDEYHYVGLHGTIEYGFVIPMILFCTDVESVYNDYLTELLSLIDEKPDIYEIAWMWLFNKEYKHDLPVPKSVMFPKLWKFYGVEV